MIPPSSLARLVLGYLEEEGLHRTAESFHGECDEAIMKQDSDPFVQYSSLKSILQEYLSLKDSACNNDTQAVVPSLWKNLDVLIGQLKYHTIPKPKPLKLQKQRKNPCSTTYERIQASRPTIKPASSRNNTEISNSTRTAIKSRGGAIGSQNDNVPQYGIQPVQSVIVTGMHVPVGSPSKWQSVSIPSVHTHVPIIPPLPLRNLTSRQPSSVTTASCCINDVAGSGPMMSTATRSNSDVIICTNSRDGTSASTVNTASIVVEAPTDSMCESIENSQSEASAITGAMLSSIGGIESKSPKRKGNPPKKRHLPNPSPAKMLPIDLLFPDDTVDLQQLLDGEKVADAAMPFLLDAFLNTPLLQEKLAENINKVVGSTKPSEVSEIVITETIEGPSTSVEDHGKDDLHMEVPVEDILCLLEADPVFESFFSMLGIDGAKAVSPTKDPHSFPSCTLSEPVPTSSSVSYGMSNQDPHSFPSCTPSEPVPTSSTVSYGISSQDSQSATSLITESLLLLASSPSKFSTSTSVTCALENTTPVVVSKLALTPENHDRQEVQCTSRTVLDSDSDMHVRALHFSSEETPAVPPEIPRKVRPGRPRKYSKILVNEKTRCPKKSKKLKNKVPPSRRLLLPKESVLFGNMSSQPAVKLMQSLASAHGGAPIVADNMGFNGTTGSTIEMRKVGGSTMLQLLQDAAVMQQVQGGIHEGCDSVASQSGNIMLLTQGNTYLQPVTTSTFPVGTSIHGNTVLVPSSCVLQPSGNQQHSMLSQLVEIPYTTNPSLEQRYTMSQVLASSAPPIVKPEYNASVGPADVQLLTTNTPLNPLSSTSNFSMYGYMSGSPSSNMRNQRTGSINSTHLPLQTDSKLAYSTNRLPSQGAVYLVNKQTDKPVNSGRKVQGNDQNTSPLINRNSQQYIVDEHTTGQSSSESSPMSQNAEDCVSSFCKIPDHAIVRSNSQNNSALSDSKGDPLVSTTTTDLNTKLKGNNRSTNNERKKRKGKVKKHTVGDSCVDKAFDQKLSNEENHASPAYSLHSTDSGSCGNEVNEEIQGLKRPGSSDLKENKPKRSRGSKNSKKSKSTKDLPKNFDVEKFLSRLHYVEK